MTMRTTRTSWKALGLVAALGAAAFAGGCVGEPVDDPVEGPMDDLANGPADGSVASPPPTAGADSPAFAADVPAGSSTPAPVRVAAPGQVLPGPSSGSGPGDAPPADAVGPPGQLGQPSAPAPSRTVTVDCLATLPCVAGEPDGGWSVSLTSTRDAGTPTAPRPSVDFELRALTRDTELGLSAGAGRLVDGRDEPASSLGLGPADAVRHALVPGRAVAGRIAFDAPPVPLPDVFERVWLVLDEADTLTTLAFENVPWPSDAATAVDCANALPCTWTSADGGLALNIDAIGLVRWHHSTRLILDWNATLDRPAELSLADTARAVTDEGKSLEYYGIDFGAATSRGEGALAAPATAGAPVPGRVVFRRAPPETATSLANASFELYRDEADGADTPVRWRIELRNLPLGR